jgi:hypothetical protein
MEAELTRKTAIVTPGSVQGSIRPTQGGIRQGGSVLSGDNASSGLNHGPRDQPGVTAVMDEE